MLLFFNKVQDGISSISGVEPVADQMITDWDNNLGWVLDFFIIMMLLAMPIASMLLAFFNNIHPLFFWASLGVTMLLVIMGSAFGDSFTAIANDGNISPVASQMPMSTLVFNNFGIYAFLCVLIIAAGVFVKTRSALGYYQ